MILTLQNDIFSFNKEVLEEKKRAEKPIGNSVYQYQREFKCSSKTAIDRVCEMLVKEKNSFDELCQAISEKYPDNEKLAKLYPRSIRALIKANQRFCKFYHRYKIANDKAAPRKEK